MLYLEICIVLVNYKVDSGFGYWDIKNFFVKFDDVV